MGEEIAVYSARRIVASTAAERPSIEEAMAFAYTFELRGFDVSIRPLQIPSEIQALLELLQAARPHTIVEIGAAHGGTLFLFATVAADGARIISIDLPDGYRRRREQLYRAFSRPGQRIDLIRGDSHDARTVRETEELVDGCGIDLQDWRQGDSGIGLVRVAAR
jgi:cephalosporin hydroxylase